MALEVANQNRYRKNFYLRDSIHKPYINHTTETENFLSPRKRKKVVPTAKTRVVKMSTVNQQPSQNESMTTAAQETITQEPVPTPNMSTEIRGRGSKGEGTLEACTDVCCCVACCPCHGQLGAGSGNDCGANCGGCDC
ncbi:predicted protein [Sclerotinia sclerotiorum 1980 UF-70]|uniref:Uncharacterized protein n=1 Tax=Sclerotinia sclerotiorum (strain ATCC 18683 / 1980 / Ss-1) TaxID=665079 RepID=A7EUN3_SCLS1|nr:predicted protein [Sclerotinia sclerotiorum 1980 UF-70]EDN93175.1 predicted protein [Sclerotinia sclerotiorum 1980 UF-70]